MVIAGIPLEEIRHTRAVQDWLAEGRQEGEAAVTLRLLNRRCGPLSDATTVQIQALPREQLEALADALLDARPPPCGPARLPRPGRPGVLADRQQTQPNRLRLSPNS